MSPRLILAALCTALLAACAGPAPRGDAPPVATAAQPPQVVTITERYVSDAEPDDELDSLATWTTEDGRTWLIASAKSSDRLVVFDADSGARLRTVGGPGDAPGRFDRPNGLAVFGDLLFVVERDNARVQVLTLPDFASLGSFGHDQLRSPYGIWLQETAPGELEAYVTDSFMYGERFDVVPPLAELDQRVRRYALDFDADGRVRARYLGAFGDTSEEAALRVVESIAGDPAYGRLLIADERLPAPAGDTSTLREYTLAGRYTGRSLPPRAFDAEAEGIALWACTGRAGYWVAVDQLAPLTVFHLFDRATLAPAGSFRGTVAAYTDGIALHAAATPSFPQGALFAVHDDEAVVAFDLGEVARALRLDGECGG